MTTTATTTMRPEPAARTDASHSAPGAIEETPMGPQAQLALGKPPAAVSRWERRDSHLRRRGLPIDAAEYLRTEFCASLRALGAI